MTRAKPKLRKREIALALAAGLLASGAGAVILSEMHEDEADDVVRLVDSRELRVGEFNSRAARRGNHDRGRLHRASGGRS
jgi:hypothetical protein